MGWMNKFTLLRAVILIIPQGILKMREFKKHFQAEMAARIHQLTRGMRREFYDTFTSNGSVLPVVQVGARAKVRAKLAPTVFIRCSLVFRSSS